MQVQKFWFYLEPYIYLSIKKNNVLLYNTLDGEYIVSEDVCVLKLMKRLHNKRNNGVISLYDSEIAKPNISSFIRQVREMFFGDYFEQNMVTKKSVQFYPLLSFQEQTVRKTKFNDRLLGENMFDYLYQVNINSIALVRRQDFEKLLNITLSKIRVSRLRKLKIIISKYEQLNYSLEILKKFELPFLEISWEIEINEKNTDCIIKCIDSQQKINLLINSRFITNNINGISSIISLLHNNCLLTMNVETNDDLFVVEKITNGNTNSKIKINPFFNGCNIDFFIENVFLDKNDILSVPQSMKDIMRNRVLNKNDFGILNVLANGDVYANLNFSILGNIFDDNIREIVIKEMHSGKSWLRTRKKEPCRSCIYQFLCPSPSDYEIAIGKPNLCHVHP